MECRGMLSQNQEKKKLSHIYEAYALRFTYSEMYLPNKTFDEVVNAKQTRIVQ